MSNITNDLGKVAITPKGNYNPQLNYEILDIVKYNNTCYMAIQAVPVGIVPDEDDYWQKLVDNTAAQIAAASATEQATAASGSATAAAASAASATEQATAASGSATAAAASAALDRINKADKVTQATNNNFAGLDTNGNLIDLQINKTEFTEIKTNVEDINGYLGFMTNNIYGVNIDLVNKTFTRLAGARGKSTGIDFDGIVPFGGRKKCNVADDGTINAFQGQTGYIEDGTNGQVMIYQPKFWYKVVPVELDPISTGIGYHMRKGNYYLATEPTPGFKLFPAFVDALDNEIDYILLSAYEGSIYDVSALSYLSADEQIGDFTPTTGDKFCSVAGVKPASGLTQNLTRSTVEILAQNRGTGWHSETIKSISVNQYLMLIEMGMLNMQTAIGQGVTAITDNPSYNCSSLTGSTVALNRGTGEAVETVNEIEGTQTTYNVAGKRSICYRGIENIWGNIWGFIYGMNIYGDGNMGGGQPYICDDFSFAESKNSENYKPTGFTLTNTNGYISAFGYSPDYDWLFLPSEALGNSALPVGDYSYITANLSGYKISCLGGSWDGGGVAGPFCWRLHNGVGYRGRGIGGRLQYVPSKADSNYLTNISNWNLQQ